MVGIWYCGVILWILFAVDILLIVINGTKSVYMDYAVFLAGLVYVYTPLAAIALAERLKQKKIMNALKKHSSVAEAKIVSYSRGFIFSRRQPFLYKFFVVFEYEGNKILYPVHTNNKKAEECVASGILPVCYLPAYCDFYIGKITKKEFFKELGFRVRLGHPDTFPLMIYAEDIENKNLPV